MEQVKRGRGRPPGSKNKPKVQPYPSPTPAPLQLPRPAPIPRDDSVPVKPEDDYFYLSVEEYMRAAFEEPLNPLNLRRFNEHKRGECYSGRDWWGCDAKSTQEVINLVNSGWTDGASRLSILTEGLDFPEIKSPRRKLAWLDEGDEFDHQKLFSGDIETMWRRPVRQWSHAPGRYRVVVSVGANSSISGDEFFWCGACAMVLSDLLSNAGHAVEILAVYQNNNDSNNRHAGNFLRSTTILKEYDAPLNITSLTAVTSLAGFFRSVGFTWKCSKQTCRVRDNLGWSLDVHEADLKHLPQNDADHVFLAGSDIRSADKARQWLQGALAKFM